jgi:16S rRNA (cytosine967-C5)-methyltransferase
MNPRAIAARILAAVITDGQSLSRALETLPRAAMDERALIQEMCYGSLRDYHRLEGIVRQLLRKPLKAKDGDVQALLLLGLYQLMAMRVPDHAAVSETVAATQALGKPWARGLVNGVLRNFQRRAEQLQATVASSDEGRWSHPLWLIDELRRAWPDEWQAVLQANNQRPPMSLRVNRAQGDVAQVLADLQAAAIAAHASTITPSAIRLDQAVDVTLLPGFAEGRLSVQDEAAQWAAPLLCLEENQRVLDLCAAPGGKAGHILETAAVELVAVDVDGERLQRVEENLKRLGKTARCLVGDGRRPESWWDGQAFDRILMDAPCSATGVIRRHPDIKLLRRPADISALVKLQAEMLDAVWPLLKPGGMLLYATCSVLPQENSEQMTAFLARQPEAQARALPVSWGREVAVGRQILPGDGAAQGEVGGMDGFYYACLEKRS